MDHGSQEVLEDINCPSIHELFVYYDPLYFEGLLGNCTVEWSPKKMTRWFTLPLGLYFTAQQSTPLMSIKQEMERKTRRYLQNYCMWYFSCKVFDICQSYLRHKTIVKRIAPSFGRTYCIPFMLKGGEGGGKVSGGSAKRSQHSGSSRSSGIMSNRKDLK